MTGEKESWFPRTLVAQLELLVKVGLIAAGCVAVAQYFETRQEQRVARTLAFVDRFEAEHMLRARQALVDAFRSVAPMVSRLESLELAPPAADQVEGAVSEYLTTQAGGDGVSAEIDTVVGFFEGLNACLRAELCDGSMADDFFGAYARDLQRNLGPYIERTRQNRTPQYGAGLEAVVARGAASPTAQ